MSVATGTAEVLKALEEELARYPYMASGEAGGDPSLYLSERIREVRRLLTNEEQRWIDIPKAKRLLGLDSEETVRAWIKARLLRSRTQPNGEVQVLLGDVLRDREAAEGLTAFGGRDMTEEEMEAEHLARPGTLPWERERADKPKWPQPAQSRARRWTAACLSPTGRAARCRASPLQTSRRTCRCGRSGSSARRGAS